MLQPLILATVKNRLYKRTEGTYRCTRGLYPHGQVVIIITAWLDFERPVFE